MIKGKILVIDDEEKLRGLLARIIELEGYQVHEAGTGSAGLKKLRQQDIDIVIGDVKLPDINGIELAEQIKKTWPHTAVILLTAFGNIADGVKAIKNGAFDYIVKGDDNDKIIPLLQRAMEHVQLQRRVIQLEKQIGEKYGFDNIIGHSVQIQKVIDLARKVAPTDTTVLLLGETGTGKEVFAQAIHHGSNRCQRPFIAVNCSAISKDLLESELFGHKAGSFTGALKDTKGLFEEANMGTIFLDEIGEMNTDMQSKLLRVLESGEFMKIGNSLPTRVNVRIIAATNRNIRAESEKGLFREDLFYRLSAFSISLPPLRERINDIEPLARFFVQKFATRIKKRDMRLHDAYLAQLKNHTWKGNIRELKNTIERSVILTDGQLIETDSLAPELQYTANNDPNASEFDLALMEKLHIQKVLKHTSGNKTEAARLLNIGLTTLYRKIEEYKI